MLGVILSIIKHPADAISIQTATPKSPPKLVLKWSNFCSPLRQGIEAVNGFFFRVWFQIDRCVIPMRV